MEGGNAVSALPEAPSPGPLVGNPALHDSGDLKERWLRAEKMGRSKKIGEEILVRFLNNWAPRTTLRAIAVLVHVLEGCSSEESSLAAMDREQPERQTVSSTQQSPHTL